MVEHNKALGQSCLDRTGELLGHVDTVSVARDLEALRIALGDAKLNWLGISYGTMIGAQYAELFPENIRAMVLDGIVDHSASEIYATAGESVSYEDELNRFLIGVCRTRDALCMTKTWLSSLMSWCVR